MPFIEKCLMPGNRAPPRRRAWTSTESMSLPINAVSASSGDITWFQPFTNSAFCGSARFSGEPKMCLLAAITEYSIVGSSLVILNAILRQVEAVDEQRSYRLGEGGRDGRLEGIGFLRLAGRGEARLHLERKGTGNRRRAAPPYDRDRLAFAGDRHLLPDDLAVDILLFEKLQCAGEPVAFEPGARRICASPPAPATIASCRRPSRAPILAPPRPCHRPWEGG